MRHSLILCAALAAWIAAVPGIAEQGIHPRPAIEDYPAHQNARTQDTRTVAIGAALLPGRQVKKVFSPDLDKTYVVVEMGLFPIQGGKVKVAAVDFALKIGDDLIYPATAPAAAASLDRGRDPNRGWNNNGVHGTAGAAIGYESGTDPVTGQRVHGWTKSAGVGVTNDPAAGPYPDPDPPSRPDPRNIQADVEDRALPEGEIAHPVAGYLYFPVPSKLRKKGQLLLLYLAGDSPVTMPLEN